MTSKPDDAALVRMADALTDAQQAYDRAFADKHPVGEPLRAQYWIAGWRVLDAIRQREGAAL